MQTPSTEHAKGLVRRAHHGVSRPTLDVARRARSRAFIAPAHVVSDEGEVVSTRFVASTSRMVRADSVDVGDVTSCARL